MVAPEFDPGPPPAFAALFGDCPPPTAFQEHFWFAWGPVFYRGRLDGSARLLAIASDPGATEKVAGRTLVGDAGQRVQGFLAKAGLDRSYVLANAFPYSFRPSHGSAAKPILRDSDQMTWRNRLYDALAGPNIQAIVAFGQYAQFAVDKWTSKPAGVPVLKVPHPTSRVESTLLDEWRAAVTTLRGKVTPDPSVPPISNYGPKFLEADYAPIPRRDLPFGVPSFVGDDAWVRAAKGHGSVTRPDDFTIEWAAPKPAPAP